MIMTDIKREVFQHYGNGTVSCVKCGFDDARALSIDHINGGGRKHIKQIRGNFYKWLAKNNFPKGYQTLCMNCQWIKRYDNGEYSGDRIGLREQYLNHRRKYGKMKEASKSKITKQQILKWASSHGCEFSLKELAWEFGLLQKEMSCVYCYLTRMVKGKELIRIGRGLYRVA
jgi:hypothetical protein